MKLCHLLRDRLKTNWMRLLLRGIRYSSNYKKIDFIYLANDPWRMSSPVEEYRFRAINQLIRDRFGRLESILEIGCGEGHQSLYLLQVCDRLVGLDVSARAVERARSRQPNGVFVVGDTFSQEVDARAPFDLVIASEVLYYMNDVPAVLRRMRLLGRNNLVTYFADEMENLDPHVLSLPGAVSQMLEFENASWRAAWWPGDLH